MDIMLNSDADKMKDQLKIIRDKTKSSDEVAEALEDLQYLVESIDNANGAQKSHISITLAKLMVDHRFKQSRGCRPSARLFERRHSPRSSGKRSLGACYLRL